MSDGPGAKFGPWNLIAVLGHGGNATVYRASRGDGNEVALKVIDARRAEAEPYRRFVQEIKFLRDLGDFPGVLPLLDAHLPEVPSKADRPWLSMPIATPIAEALAGAPLETVVDALAQIADTLARLAERKVGHRDLKPGNLYKRVQAWQVGDFGLVAAPDADDDITRSGKALGPAHFTAYEMILDPVHTDPLPADVYSFGKTVWSLATGIPFPPHGHQPADTPKWSIADARPHRSAGALDQLVDRATRLTPGARPTMSDLARDLRAWGQLGAAQPVLDVSELRAKLRTKMEREIAAEDLAQERTRLAHRAARRLQELCRPLDAALKDAHPRPELDILGDQLTHTMLSRPRYGGMPQVVFSYERASKIASSADARRYALVYGRGLELDDAGTLTVRSFVMVHFERVMGVDFEWSSPERTAAVGSIEADRLIEEAVAELAPKLREGLAVFVEKLPSD